MMTIKKNLLCLFCQSEATRLFLSIGKKNYYQCLKCFLIFLYPLPAPVILDSFNKNHYGQKEQIKNYFFRERYWQKTSQRMISDLKKIMTKDKPSLLDVGCHYGLFMTQAKKAGFEVFGIEKEKEAVLFARDKFNLKVIKADFMAVNLERKFDVITLIDVFEHLLNLKRAINQIKKHLKEDSIVFIQCPNIESIMFRITKKKWNWLLPDVHLYQFSIKSLTKIFNENGFQLVFYRTYDDISEFAYNIIDWLGVKKRNIWEKIIWKGLRVFLLLILPLGSFFWSRWGYGGLINVVFIKKTED